MPMTPGLVFKQRKGMGLVMSERDAPQRGRLKAVSPVRLQLSMGTSCIDGEGPPNGPSSLRHNNRRPLRGGLITGFG